MAFQVKQILQLKADNPAKNLLMKEINFPIRLRLNFSHKSWLLFYLQIYFFAIKCCHIYGRNSLKFFNTERGLFTALNSASIKYCRKRLFVISMDIF